jgi:DNA-binding XRE family transcriptional regulator
MNNQTSSDNSPKKPLCYAVPPYFLGTLDNELPVWCIPGEMYASLASDYAPTANDCKNILVSMRSQLHWSRPMLSAFLGVSRETLRKWETGERNPNSAARRLIWLTNMLVCDRSKLESGLDLIFWGRGAEIRAFNQAFQSRAEKEGESPKK